MIPTNHEHAFKKALQNAFGVSVYDQIEPLTKGLSGSLVFKLTVKGIHYLLRIIKANSRDNPGVYFSSMQIAAARGLAPKIIYLSAEDGISITEFIKELSFTVPEARVKMAGLIRDLHKLPKFSSQLNYLDAADRFVQQFRTTQIISETKIENIYKSYQQISNIYPRVDRENLVSSHNDIKPDNIIFDGTKPWLVDWEAARLNDRYLDLAACANFVVKNDKDEADFLERYFGKKPCEYQQARFYLMCNIVHMFCFCLCTMMVGAGKPVDIDIEHMGFAAFHEGLWKGEINLGNKEEKLQYALVHLEEFKRKSHSERFSDSLRLVAENHTGVRTTS